jgi:hypothetical protein
MPSILILKILIPGTANKLTVMIAISRSSLSTVDDLRMVEKE